MHTQTPMCETAMRLVTTMSCNQHQEQVLVKTYKYLFMYVFTQYTELQTEYQHESNITQSRERQYKFNPLL